MAESKKERKEENKSEQLENKWEELIETCRGIGYFLEIEFVKELIYDTFVYFRGFEKDDRLKPSDLKIYRHMCEFLCTEYYPTEWLASDFDNCTEFVAGMCALVELGAESGSFQGKLPLITERYIPKGCPQPEADMSSYEAFDKSFEENLKLLIEDNDLIPYGDI